MRELVRLQALATSGVAGPEPHIGVIAPCPPAAAQLSVTAWVALSGPPPLEQGAHTAHWAAGFSGLGFKHPAQHLVLEELVQRAERTEVLGDRIEQSIGSGQRLPVGLSLERGYSRQ